MSEKKNWFQKVFSKTETVEPNFEEIAEKIIEEKLSDSQPQSNYGGHVYGQWQPIINRRWDGEKTPGELGVVQRNIADHIRLRLRSYQAMDTNDAIKSIANRYFQYVIGAGLKLQSEPNKTVLEMEGVTEDLTDFKKNVEARFQVWANSKMCSNDELLNLHDLALNAYSTAFSGGDSLIVLRVKKGRLKVQVFDGEHLQTPSFEKDLMDEVDARGNYVSHGIEYDDDGRHIGFFVKVQEKGNPLGRYEYIKAKGTKSNRTFAWMFYGEKQRPDHLRGIPKLSTSLEKSAKLDRYTEASVGKAEEAANLLMAIEHTIDSTGENPLAKSISKKLKVSGEEKTSYELADGLANKITQTTSKQTVNLPIGAKLSSFSTDIETSFPDFYNAIFDTISSSGDVPPEVVKQVYNSNYSASRAAIGTWQYICEIERTRKPSNNFYGMIYKFWLEIQVLQNKIEAPGYIEGLNSDNFMLIEAYSACRFTGKKMPHIDPLKEVKAARAILGDDTTPLSSFEKVCEDLNLGDWSENFEKILEEKKKIPQPTPEPNNEPNNE